MNCAGNKKIEDSLQSVKPKQKPKEFNHLSFKNVKYSKTANTAINRWQTVLRNETDWTHWSIKLASFVHRTVHRIKDCGLAAVCWTKTKALVQILYFLIQKFLLNHIWISSEKKAGSVFTPTLRVRNHPAFDLLVARLFRRKDEKLCLCLSSSCKRLLGPPECHFCMRLKIGTLNFKEEKYLDLSSSPSELAPFDC